MYALIMAGGSGTRLWPVSRKNTPKQLLGFIGKQTLLQATFRRLSKGFSSKRVFVATMVQYAKNIQRQLPKVPKTNYSLEPELKDRGPAIGLAALLMHHYDPKSCFVTAWSDHYISDEEEYFKTLELAEAYLDVDPGVFITIGAQPTFPHTGLGYIEKSGHIKNSAGIPIHRVKSFTEKPPLEKARQFVKSGRYLWNTGYFVCRTDTLLSLYEQHLPEVYALLMKIKPSLGTKQQQAAINQYYKQMPKVDIEHGLIEKLDNIAVLPATFDWADIGSWKVIKDVLSDDDQNLVEGLAETHATEGTLIYNYEKKLVACIGLKDMIVVNTKDALLIVPKEHSEQVKDLVQKLKDNKKLHKHL